MSQKIPEHVSGLIKYLGQPEEKANEDLAVGFFRKEFGEQFTRQADAKRADGYVPGIFVLELKGKTSDWYSGFMQGLAYNRDLDFSQVIVGAKEFLTVWSIDSIPNEIVDAARTSKGAPSTVGKLLAKKYKHKKKEVLEKSSWSLRSELLSEGLFSDLGFVVSELKHFIKTLKSGKRVRKKVTPNNFTKVLKQMVQYFDPNEHLMSVRAFYSLIFSWDKTSKVEISSKHQDKVTFGGEDIRALIPDKRSKFAAFVEQHQISLNKNQHIDDFFATYDKALDTVDPDFRKKNGIFFTDLNLSRLAMWLVKNTVGDIGKNYLVIDPACGSGNLVMNWRSPLDLRHKVVSEIEPELLFAVERRMKGDPWHSGKYTVVPKVSENIGLNFLDIDAECYLEKLKSYLNKKGHDPNKPIAFLCNPPYKNDDDQSAKSVNYSIHQSILDLTGIDASSERYCCFLAQMKKICEAAKSSDLPGDSLIFIFTKTSWLTKRPIFNKIRKEILGDFEDVGGMLINGKEFFDLKGKFPIAFTIWRYKGKGNALDSERSIPLLDITWLKKKELVNINWDIDEDTQKECELIFTNKKTIKVRLGENRKFIDSNWCGNTLREFQRSRRISEVDNIKSGGLPLNDTRRHLKKTYGEPTGNYIGFMDDLTPVRINQVSTGKPWFRLNKPFMDCRKTRCFSGPPDQKGYEATNSKVAEKLFLWFSLSRTLESFGYPMWCDNDKLWVPSVPASIKNELNKISNAIVFSDNECIDAFFPANNPVNKTQEIYISNPLTPLDPNSYWNSDMSHLFKDNSSTIADNLVIKVNAFYKLWGEYFNKNSDIVVSYKKPYFIEAGVLTKYSGLRQIVDYSKETQEQNLLNAWKEVQDNLKKTKERLYLLLIDENVIDYFGKSEEQNILKIVSNDSRSSIEDRAALASYIVNELHSEKTFGRIKFTKLFFLADSIIDKDLKMNYYREAAGPLDPYSLYNKKTGIEKIASDLNYFNTSGYKKSKAQKVDYIPGDKISDGVIHAKKIFKKELPQINNILKLLKSLNTERCEIIATLYACWNDMIIEGREITDEGIVDEFYNQWHKEKQRFERVRLLRAIPWMREKGIVPNGRAPKTIPHEPPNQDDFFNKIV